MDQLNAIRVFSRVVQLGGFTKAAAALGMPKTTVSKLIRDLEAHLGVKLLERSTRHVRVTEAGSAYFERTTRWLAELSAIDDALDEENAQRRGRVHADVSGWVASAVIIPRLPEFYARYPDIRVELSVSDRTGHLIRESADCAVRSGALDDPSMVARRLGASRWVTAATPAYLRRHGIPRHPAELARGHLVVHHQLTRSGRSPALLFRKGSESMEITAPSILTVNESNAHLAAGVAGIGILYSFEWKLRPYLDAGTLVSILKDWQPPPYVFHLVYPPNRHLSARVRVFVDWIGTVFDDLAG